MQKLTHVPLAIAILLVLLSESDWATWVANVLELHVRPNFPPDSLPDGILRSTKLLPTPRQCIHK